MHKLFSEEQGCHSTGGLRSVTRSTSLADAHQRAGRAVATPSGCQLPLPAARPPRDPFQALPLGAEQGVTPRGQSPGAAGWGYRSGALRERGCPEPHGRAQTNTWPPRGGEAAAPGAAAERSRTGGGGGGVEPPLRGWSPRRPRTALTTTVRATTTSLSLAARRPHAPAPSPSAPAPPAAARGPSSGFRCRGYKSRFRLSARPVGGPAVERRFPFRQLAPPAP